MSVTNALEQVVPATVDRVLAPDHHIRSCASCRDDVIALALTSLEPRYSASNLGKILKLIDLEKAQNQARITVAVMTAIGVVEQNPHHRA